MLVSEQNHMSSGGNTTLQLTLMYKNISTLQWISLINVIEMETRMCVCVCVCVGGGGGGGGGGTLAVRVVKIW